MTVYQCVNSTLQEARERERAQVEQLWDASDITLSDFDVFELRIVTTAKLSQ
jgi:hypothetical protein